MSSARVTATYINRRSSSRRSPSGGEPYGISFGAPDQEHVFEFQALGGMDGGDGHAFNVAACAKCFQHGQAGLSVIRERGVLPSAVSFDAVAQVLFAQCPAEDFLLRVDSGEDGAVARRCSLVHESADACSHAPGFFEIAVVDGLRDSAALVSLGVEFEIVGALR